MCACCGNGLCSAVAAAAAAAAATGRCCRCVEKLESISFFLGLLRCMNDVNAPPVAGEWARSVCDSRPWLDENGGDGLRFSSSSVELARNGEPVTEMLSVSKLSSLILLSFSSVCGGVNCDEFVNEILAGDSVGLVVLCGLLALLLQTAFGLLARAGGDVVPVFFCKINAKRWRNQSKCTFWMWKFYENIIFDCEEECFTKSIAGGVV